MNLSKRANFVRAMEMIVRSLNDEGMINGWLMCGVADGDINGKETDEELEYYCDDENFADLMACFCRTMRRALNDHEFDEEDLSKGNEILYFDDVVSKYHE